MRRAPWTCDVAGAQRLGSGCDERATRLPLAAALILLPCFVISLCALICHRQLVLLCLSLDPSAC
jgi:hypothetical protein